jgi:hypothetical protein
LHGSSTNQSLKQNDSALASVVLGNNFFSSFSLFAAEGVNRGCGSHFEITHDVDLVLVVLVILLLLHCVNEDLGSLEGLHVLYFFSGQGFLELELYLADVNA